MFKKLKGVDLVQELKHKKATLYRLDAKHLINHYYVVTSPFTSKLLNSPEVIGFECYDCMCNPTKITLDYFNKKNIIQGASVLTILRGGLNYPLEECCYRSGIKIHDVNFLSCERVFEGEVIVGLDIKYKKLDIIDKGTLIIGDIVATGDTMVKCLKYVVKEYRKAGASLRNIIFFTIGGNMGITIMENLTEELQMYWPDFEGFYCVYHEGIFSNYVDKGVLGIQLPYVDFYWKDAILAPEYREQTLNNDNALFEKCTIYDGGARRYEIPDHYKEVSEYWENVLQIADKVNFKDFIDEKIGYPTPVGYGEWLELNHYNALDSDLTHRLYEQEQAYLEKNSHRSLKEIASTRLKEFQNAVGIYNK